MPSPFEVLSARSPVQADISDQDPLTQADVSEVTLQICATHPYLANVERRKAFLDLVSSPRGTYRGWARKWNWTLPRVQRFITNLAKERLATVLRTGWGTFVDIGYAPDTKPIQPRDTRPIHRVRALNTHPIPLGSKTGKQLNLETRSIDSNICTTESNDYTTILIESMNEILSHRFGDEYRRVMYDNRRSAKAGARLRAAGVPLAFAREQVQKSCRLFNPSKHGRGELPGTLGYFEKGVLTAFFARDRTDAGLSQKDPWPEDGNSTRGGAPEKLLNLVDVVVDRCVVRTE